MKKISVYSSIAIALLAISTNLLLLHDTNNNNNYYFQCGVVAQTITKATTGTSDPSLKVFSNLEDVRFLPENQLSVTTSAFHLHLYEPLQQASDYWTFPVFAAPSCLAFNTSKGTIEVQFTLQQLSNWLTGTVQSQTISSVLEPTPLTTNELRLYIAVNSPVSSVIRKGMRLRGVAGWNDDTAFPAAVLSNPNITFVANDADVLAYLANTSGSAGFISLGVGAGLRCANLLLADDVSKQMRIVSPRLPARIYNFLLVDPVAATLSTTGATYPFVGPILLSVRKVSICWLSRLQKIFDFTARIFSDPSTYATVAPYGFGEVSPSARVAILSAIYASLPCLSTQRVVAGGSDTIAPATASWILSYVWRENIFVDYVTSTSLAGTDRVRAGTLLLASSEIVYNDLQRVVNPRVTFIPGLASSISIVFNVPGVPNLVLPRCVIVAIFRYAVVYWDDPMIMAANPSMPFPHEKIISVQRSDDSSLQSLWATGFQAIASKCPAYTVASATWFQDVISVYNATGFVDIIARTPYAIAVMPTSLANAKGLPQAYVFDEETATVTTPTVEFVQNTLSNSSYDRSLDRFSLTTSSTAYPFAGLTYFVFDNDQAKFNCTPVKQMYDFAIWAMSSDAGKQIATDEGYVPLTDNLLSLALSRLLSSRCKGAILYPVPVAAQLNFALIGGAGGGGLLALLVLLAVFQHWFARRNLKSDKFAVTEPGTNFAIVFTDIQASTTLWSVVPAQMGPALDLHNNIMKDLAEKHRGYVVKTVGDSYVMVYKDATDALKFAIECQLALHRADWGTDELDIAYARLYGDPASPFNNDQLYHNRSDPELFNGLCVRIGLHYGTADVKKEGESYDYFGSDVNLAARIESCAHGGQIVVSDGFFKHVLDVAPDAFNETSVKSLGRNQLRGVPEPVELVQVLPGAFARRLFPALRLDNVDRNDEDDDDDPTDSADQATNNYDAASSVQSASIRSDLGGHSVNHPLGNDLTRQSNTSSNRSGSTKDATNTSKVGGITATTTSSNGTQNPNAANLTVDERFVRFMSHKADVDAHGVQKIYRILKNTFSPFSNADRKKTLLSDITKEWRLPDMKSAAHKQFKQDLGFEAYWLIRIAVKVQSVVAVQLQQERLHKAKSTASQGETGEQQGRSKGEFAESDNGGHIYYGSSASRSGHSQEPRGDYAVVVGNLSQEAQEHGTSSSTSIKKPNGASSVIRESAGSNVSRHSMEIEDAENPASPKRVPTGVFQAQNNNNISNFNTNNNTHSTDAAKNNNNNNNDNNTPPSIVVQQGSTASTGNRVVVASRQSGSSQGKYAASSDAGMICVSTNNTGEGKSQLPHMQNF